VVNVGDAAKKQRKGKLSKKNAKREKRPIRRSCPSNFDPESDSESEAEAEPLEREPVYEILAKAEKQVGDLMRNAQEGKKSSAIARYLRVLSGQLEVIDDPDVEEIQCKVNEMCNVKLETSRLLELAGEVQSSIYSVEKKLENLRLSRRREPDELPGELIKATGSSQSSTLKALFGEMEKSFTLVHRFMTSN
jgi:hypothetical protein